MDSVGDNYHTETFVDACDKLLEKMRCLSEELDKDYYSTCNGGEDAATTASNLFETGQNGNSKDVSKLSSPKRPTDFTSNIDKITNYRYSFYENSNKISVYVASSATITQALAEYNQEYNQSSRDELSNGKQQQEAITSKPFGCHPNTVQLSSGGQFLPDFIERALAFLDLYGLKSVGIFRKSGVKSRINALKKQIEDGIEIEFDSSCCVFDVADLVKTWLRDLNPHLIGKELIDNFTKSKDTFSLWHLDDSHRYLLFVVLKFLSSVCSHSKQNQMTAHNLAICFAPSLCHCDDEHYIRSAQKCLEHCIENVESLFYISIDPTTSKTTPSLNRHTSSTVICASPQDILSRLLHQRSIIDPLILEWRIKDSSLNCDIIEVNFQFSRLTEVKTFVFKRSWKISKNESITLNEDNDSFKSTWILSSSGEGTTRTVNDVYLDFRGFSRHWYQSTFAAIHDQQLQQLSSSFQPRGLLEDSSSSNHGQKLLISDV